jgi:uncharacterized membrane protein YpjA
MTGWVAVNDVVDLVNQVEGELPELESLVAKTGYSSSCFSLREACSVLKLVIVFYFRKILRGRAIQQ